MRVREVSAHDSVSDTGQHTADAMSASGLSRSRRPGDVYQPSPMSAIALMQQPDDDDGRNAGNRRKRTKVPLSAAIGALAALSIVAVASMALGITLTSSVSAVDDVGRKYAEALVADGRRTTENFFDDIVRLTRVVCRLHEQDGFMLPSDRVRQPASNGDLFEQLRETYGFLLTVRLLNPAIARHTVIFDDGSFCDAPPVTPDGRLEARLINGRVFELNLTNTDAPASRGFRTSMAKFVGNLSDGPGITWPNVPTDPRIQLYRTFRPIVSASARGLWIPIVVMPSADLSTFELGLPVGIPVFNQTQFIGLTTGFASLAGTTAFLRALGRTRDSELFLLDGIPSIVATTYDKENPVTLTPTVSRTAVPGPNCANSGELIPEGAADAMLNHTIGCRALPSSYSYAPLRAIAELHPAWLRPAAGTVSVDSFDVDGEAHYAARAGLSNSERAFQLSLVLIMPEADILGGIVEARNGAIGAVVAGTVVLAALCALLIAIFLRPLGDVARRMRRTARLEEAAPRDADSVFSEVYDLQNAYAQMNTAISSFTRYVPRDVVKDLMASGELCAIEMVPKQCTMLFVDIAGFTSMCERVAPDELSELVRLYFERMSSLVMGHAGLIDKYVGDCIMAVWGAPFAVANPEVKATLCGLRLVRETRVAPLADRFDAAGERLRVRVGIASGAVLAGNMGSAERMNYTVIGDSVNLAARLESLNKQFGTEVLVCERTAERAQAVLSMRLLMAIRVVGKATAVRVYEPVGVTADAADAAPLKAPFAVNPLVARTLNAAEFTNASDAGSASSDRGSVRSSLTAGNSSNNARLRDRVSIAAVALAEEGAHLSESPIFAGRAAQERARVCTAAAEAFMNRDFAGALRQLDTLWRDHEPKDETAVRDASDAQEQASVPPSLLVPHHHDAGPHHLRELCETFLNHPPPSDFDGTVDASMK